MDIRLPIFIETWKNRERAYSMKICRRTKGSPIDKRELYLKGDKKEWELLDERTCEVGTIRPEFLVISFFNENDHKQISYILAFPKNFLMGDVQANKCKKKTRKGGKKRKERRKFRAVSSSSSLFSDIKIYYKYFGRKWSTNHNSRCFKTKTSNTNFSLHNFFCCFKWGFSSLWEIISDKK